MEASRWTLQLVYQCPRHAAAPLCSSPHNGKERPRCNFHCHHETERPCSEKSAHLQRRVSLDWLLVVFQSYDGPQYLSMPDQHKHYREARRQMQRRPRWQGYQCRWTQIAERCSQDCLAGHPHNCPCAWLQNYQPTQTLYYPPTMGAPSAHHSDPLQRNKVYSVALQVQGHVKILYET